MCYIKVLKRTKKGYELSWGTPTIIPYILPEVKGVVFFGIAVWTIHFLSKSPLSVCGWVPVGEMKGEAMGT